MFQNVEGQTNQNSLPPSVEMNSPVIQGLVVNLKGNIVAQTAGASIDWNRSSIDWGDGTKTLVSQYTHTYSQAGTYTVTVTAYDSNNLSTTIQKTITLIAPLPPTITIDSITASGLVVNLKGNIVAQTAGASIDWNRSSIDWGDGTKTLVSQYTHTYSQAGTYTVTVTAYDSNNLSTTIQQTVNAGNSVGIASQPPSYSQAGTTPFTRTTYTLSDQSSCQTSPFNGTWDGNTLTCSISGLELKSGDLIAISSGVNLDNSGTFATAGNVTNAGTINNNAGGSIAVYTFINSGILNNNVNGSINVITLNNAGTINNNAGGSINISSSELMNIGTITNSGIVAIQSYGGISNNGTINNNAGGSITNTAGITETYMPNSDEATSSTLINNVGITNSVGGVINNSGNITNDKVGAINNYEVGKWEVGIIYNYGVINNSAGTININLGDLANDGTIHQLGYLKTGYYGGDSQGIIYNNFGGIICGDTTNAYVNASSYVKGVTTPTCNTVTPSQSAQSIVIPSWVKNNAKWWSQGQVGDDDFIKGIQYLIQQGIMQIPQTQTGSGSSQQIPAWVKNNAGWWADGQIGDSDFVKGIQYLISSGIMQIS